MPFFKVQFRPGINKQLSPTANEGGWYDGVNVRFRDGMPEKEGGYTPFSPQTTVGVTRALHDWADLAGHLDLAIGSSTKLYVAQNNTIYDITPLDTFTGTLAANLFSTTISSNVVNVNHVGHGRIAGAYVAFQDSNEDGIGLTFNGVTIQGAYTVNTVVDANNYTIIASTTASATGPGSGTSQTYVYTWNSTLTNPFTTVGGSANVTVAHTNHGRNVGDRVIFSGASSVGGLTLNGEFAVTVVIDANNYTIAAATPAAFSAGPGGGTVTYQYLLPTGLVSNTSSFGWGAGYWGGGTWGTPRSTGGIPQQARIWSLDNWGQDLVACVRGGTNIYTWITANGTSTRAVPISGAPYGGLGLIVGMPERHLIVFGAETNGAIDPMLVRWSDVENYNSFVATATNSAGSFRLSNGSQIIGVIESSQQILIFTDTAIYSMRFIGTPYVYSFTLLGQECGLISPNAAIEVNGMVYWMGLSNFYVYTGTVLPLPSTLYNAVFKFLNRNQANKIYCNVRCGFNEVIWSVPTTTDEVDSYVKFNFVENLWYGTFLAASGVQSQLVRTAFVDRDVYDTPIGTDADGNVWYDGVGKDANGAALPSELTSGYADIEQGEDFMYVSEVIPDFDPLRFSGTIELSMSAVKYPADTPFTSGPVTVTPATEIIRLPNRGRQIAFKITSDSIGDDWRLGAIRVRYARDGSV